MTKKTGVNRNVVPQKDTVNSMDKANKQISLKENSSKKKPLIRIKRELKFIGHVIRKEGVKN